MSESEHSDREFYYSGELLDTEMLQSPTHTKATDRKSFFRSGTINKFVILDFYVYNIKMLFPVCIYSR